jgi:hypothetical protein
MGRSVSFYISGDGDTLPMGSHAPLLNLLSLTPYQIFYLLSIGDTTHGDNGGETLVANGIGNQVRYLSSVASLVRCLLSSSTPRSLAGEEGKKVHHRHLARHGHAHGGRKSHQQWRGGELSARRNPQIVGEVGRGGWGRP